MENTDKKEGMGGHNCGMLGCNCGISRGCGSMGGKMCCGWGGIHRFFLLRIILLVVILGFVFEVGLKLGELKAFYSFYGIGDGYWGYGRSMMNGSPYAGSYGPGMMQWGNVGGQSTTTGR